MEPSQTRKRQRHRFEGSINHELKRLARKPDNWHGPLAAFADVCVIGAAITLGHVIPWLYPVSAFLIGTRQRALATLLHEGSHHMLCGNRRLGQGIGMVAGWSVFQAFHRYRQSHGMEHHLHLGDETRDPDIINYARQGLFEADSRSFFRKHLLPLALGFKTFINLTNLVRDRLLPRRYSSLSAHEKWEYLCFAAFWLSVVVTCWRIGALTDVLLFWVIPYLTVFQSVNWLIELAEHFPLTRLFDDELEMTRNRRGGTVENLFFGIHSENWHLVHHLYPGIPFWRLQQAHNVMMRDPVYARANSKNGGLMIQGPSGEPSILSLLGEELSNAQSPHILSA